MALQLWEMHWPIMVKVRTPYAIGTGERIRILVPRAQEGCTLLVGPNRLAGPSVKSLEVQTSRRSRTDQSDVWRISTGRRQALPASISTFARRRQAFMQQGDERISVQDGCRSGISGDDLLSNEDEPDRVTASPPTYYP